MVTTSTTNFSLPFDEAFEEAYDRVGGELASGLNDGRLLIRTTNLLFTDWMNRGVGLWQLETSTITVVTSQQNYTIGSDTFDIIGAVLTRSSIDTAMTRISFNEWLDLPDKNSGVGRPVQYFLDRQRDAPVLYLYKTPENSTDRFKYWKIRFIQDAGKMVNTPDLPRRFWPALVSGLAYYIAQKRLPLNDPMRLQNLAFFKSEYESDLMKAMEADRERASVFLVPKLRGGWRGG